MKLNTQHFSELEEEGASTTNASREDESKADFFKLDGLFCEDNKRYAKPITMLIMVYFSKPPRDMRGCVIGHSILMA